jgi:hypothetical protein
MMQARAVKAIEEALKAGLIHQDSEGFINATELRTGENGERI